MRTTAHTLPAVVRELIDENPFACRAVLQVVSLDWSTEVPTAAVSCEAQPRLLVNRGFVESHCRTETELKALLLHEFLHVLLRHTESVGPLSDEQHIAWDAVINALIHRSMGPAYSALMSRYYAEEKGVRQLLRPPRPREASALRRHQGRPSTENLIASAWHGLYVDGKLVADDIADIARDLARSRRGSSETLLLGDHEAARGAGATEKPITGPLREALDRALSTMNGSGIWREPRTGVLAAELTSLRAMQQHESDVRLWRAETLAVLRRHLSPDRRAARQLEADAEYRLPVLGASDRRAFARALWSSLIPDSAWPHAAPLARASAQVYLDVSGSMHAEMPHIVALLARLGGMIRRPFWAFSDTVVPARIQGCRLVADTTGGTGMRCVLQHLAKTRPSAAVVVTDGFIEPITTTDVKAAAATRLHAIVTREGSPFALSKAGIPYTQLRRIPA
jgi:hypothetical protein